MNELVAAPGVAQKMVVVLKTEGMVLMPWLDQVPALLEAWYPGQEDGNAVANILFGLRNPSGKLPMTFGNTEREAAYATTEQFPGVLEDPPPWLNRKRLSRAIHRRAAGGVPVVRGQQSDTGVSVRVRPVVHDVRAIASLSSRCRTGQSRRTGSHAVD